MAGQQRKRPVMRQSPSGIDRERFKIALAEVQRQAKAKREKLSLDESLDLAWRFYDAVDAPIGTHC